jgi:hypothetical protein
LGKKELHAFEILKNCNHHHAFKFKVVSILAVICGFVIGIGNDTIRIKSPNDLGVTTPATILIIYGFFLIIVTTVGCFSSITARLIISIIVNI